MSTGPFSIWDGQSANGNAQHSEGHFCSCGQYNLVALIMEPIVEARSLSLTISLTSLNRDKHGPGGIASVLMRRPDKSRIFVLARQHVWPVLPVVKGPARISLFKHCPDGFSKDRSDFIRQIAITCELYRVWNTCHL